MATFISLSILGLSCMLQVTAIPWPGLEPSQYPVEVKEHQIQAPQAPQTTDPPEEHSNLARRDIAPNANTCGWVDGNFDNPWTAANGQCLFFTNLLVANGWTTCVNYGVATPPTCGTGCLICGFLNPYCGLAAFPSGYFGHGNCQTAPGSTINIAWTYTGQSQTLDFPTFTGIGGLSTGRQPPSGIQAPAAATAAAGSTVVYTSTIVTAGSTLVVSGSTIVTAGALINPSGTSGLTGTVSTSSSTPVGAIVGGVIGGLALIGIFAVGIACFVMRGRRSRRNEPQAAAAALPPASTPGPPPDYKEAPLSPPTGYQSQAALSPQTGYQSQAALSPQTGYQSQASPPPQAAYLPHASPPPQKDFQTPPPQPPQQGYYAYPQAAELGQPDMPHPQLPAELEQPSQPHFQPVAELDAHAVR